MSKAYNFLFKYFEKENIYIDKSEFIFQVSSHPNHPSVLSIVDTLDFFGIENAMIKVDLFEIDLLPKRFAVLLENESNETQLYFVEKKGRELNLFDENNKRKNVTKDSIKERWSGIVLLVEKNKEEIILPKAKKTNWFFTIPLVCLFLAILFFAKSSLEIKLLFFFIFIGLIFSFATIKELFDSKNDSFNKFCNLTESTSCSSVVNSDKWRFFKIINLSDLSIVFFVFQFVGLFFSVLLNNEESFIKIIFYLLLLVSPLFFISIYYQKFVEKKWCPLCLVIILISVSELVYINLNINFRSIFSLNLLLLFSFIFIAISYLWISIKEILVEKKDLKEFKLKALKFQRNYQIFKNSLLSSSKITLPKTPIVLGNKNSKTILTVITNPFCGHCQKVHEIVDKILDTNNDIQVQLIIKTNLENEDQKRRKFYTSIINSFIQKDENYFINSFKDWFNNKDVDKWLNKYELVDSNEMIINSFYENHNNWCVQNNFNYTPAIFINGYEYPEQFNREDLIFFVKEIVEDDTFNV